MVARPNDPFMDMFLEQLDVLLVLTAIFMAIACVAVALRVYVRAKLLHNFAGDDWALLVSWVIGHSLRYPPRSDKLQVVLHGHLRSHFHL